MAYHNGVWVAADTVSLSMLDPAVTQGVTAVERLRAYGRVWFQVDRHLERWRRTTETLSISGLPAERDLRDLLAEIVERNQSWVESQAAFGVVLFASPGRGGNPTVVMDLYRIDPSLVDRRIESGSPLVVTSIEQPSNACWPRNIKVRCRLHYYLADRFALRFDPEAIGVLIDADGTVTESGISNLLIVQQGCVISPPREQILWGVSLQVISELCCQLGIEFREERITPARLRSASEVLLTGTSCGVWFARSIDGDGDRRPGPIYQTLRGAFEQLVE